MDTITLTIDDVEVTTQEGVTVLEAAQGAGIYIPRLCAYPDLPSSRTSKVDAFIYRGNERIENDNSVKEFEGCQLCVVEIKGVPGFPNACITPATRGMVVQTNTPQLQGLRQEKLMLILANHPHACLLCAQREGCTREPCSLNTPANARCCSRFGNCELQRVAEYIGIKPETPRYNFRDLPIIKEEPLFKRDYNLCISCLRCVRICQEVRGVNALGFVFRDGKAVVGTKGPTLKESGCKFCGACIEVCPTGTLMDLEAPGAQREAILVPCRYNCPAGVDVPRYVSLIAEDKCAEAVAVIREKVPFPAVLGHICSHPCENKCRRGQVNDAINIRALKRFAAEQDTGLWKLKSKIAPASGKRVAIVGSGPAGLTAAYYLAKRGHAVTVFEALPEPGGMLRFGIPEYRLPAEVLNAEIEDIKSAGIEIKTNSRVESLGKLLEQGYNATLLAIGAHRGIKLPLPGADLEGVLVSISLLRDVRSGKEVKIGKRVLVLGGGGVAFDCARTSLRLGATEVHIACLEPRDGMLASSDEIEESEAEGIIIHPSHTFTRIVGDDGHVSGVECLDVRSFEFDKEGRLQVNSIAGSEHVLPADTVIFAIGQVPELGLTEGMSDIKTTRRRTLEVAPTTLATGKGGVFASGDAVSGPASVIAAIAGGRQAAVSIDKYLGGDGIIDEILVDAENPDPWLGRDDSFADMPRCQVTCLPVDERVRDFARVELGFDKETAVAEAERCLRCTLRLQISSPPPPPTKESWLEFNSANVSSVPEVEGVYQLLDDQKAVIYIAGTMNLRQGLGEHLGTTKAPLNKACYFLYEENRMFTVKESELIQQFTQKYGQMPEGNQELLDLF